MGSKHKIGTRSELRESGERVLTEINGREIAVFNIDGEYFAVANYCPHQAGPLCEGRLTGRISVDEDTGEWDYIDDGKIIRCPWHTWQFDVTTGESITDPDLRVPTFDVEVHDEEVYVVM